MARVTFINTAFTNQNGINLDNSPSAQDLLSFLDNVDFDAGVIIDTGSAYRSTVTQDGHVYTMAFSYNSWSMAINTLTLSVDGDTMFIMEELNLSANTLLLYEGNALMRIVFQNDDYIVGSANNDFIFGYDGNDAIYGGAGDDLINGGNGWNYINGEDGIDTAEYHFSSLNYASSKFSNGAIQVMFFDGRYDVLVSVEKLKFANMTVPSDDLSFIGTYTDVDTSNLQAAHRFYNTRDKAFFYTANPSEKNTVIANSSPNEFSVNSDSSWPYVYQGATFERAHSYQGASSLHRFYNTETGHHFFTASEDEANYVRSKSESGEWPYNYEGIAFSVYANDPNPEFEGSEIAVHRFYSSELNRHFYTSSETEVNEIVLTGQWNYEGIGFWGETI